MWWLRKGQVEAVEGRETDEVVDLLVVMVIMVVEEGQEVDIMLNQSADYVYTSKVEKKSAENLKETPDRLSGLAGGDIPSQTDETGKTRPLKPYYEAIVELPSHEVLRVGLTGRARIKTAPRTLGQRLFRYFARTFNFEF